MIIDGWSIDGYGTFARYEQRGLSAGLSVLLGPNEAGKSTLLGFIRAVLFGFPNRNMEDRHDPLYGGRHGGRLFLSGPGGLYTVQRHSDKKEALRLWRPDHSEGNEAELQQLLGHASKPLFNSIFAFSLTELQERDFQKKNEVRERIFSSSLQGARNSARTALALLERQNEPIHKHRARASALLELQDRIQTAQRDLDEARRRARDYEQLTHREHALTGQIETLGQTHVEHLAEKQRHELLLTLWPKWRDLSSLEAELARMEVIDRFPDQAAARHAELQSQVRELERSLGDRRLEREEQQRRLSGLVLDDRIRDLASAIGGLHAERSRFQEWGQALAEDESRQESARRQLAHSLGQLGAAWTRERLEGFDASLPIIDEIRHWVDRLADTEQTLAEAVRERKSAMQALETADRLLVAQEERCRELAEAPSPVDLDRREHSLIALKTNLTERKELEAELGTLKDRLQALELERRRQAPARSERLPMIVRVLLWIGALILLGVALWSLSSQTPVVAAVLGLAALVFAVLPFVRLQGSAESGSADLYLDDQFAELTAKLKRSQAALADRGRKIEGLVAELSLSAPPLQNPVQTGHRFRFKPATLSGVIRPAIPA